MTVQIPPVTHSSHDTAFLHEMQVAIQLLHHFASDPPSQTLRIAHEVPKVPIRSHGDRVAVPAVKAVNPRHIQASAVQQGDARGAIVREEEQKNKEGEKIKKTQTR